MSERRCFRGFWPWRYNKEAKYNGETMSRAVALFVALLAFLAPASVRAAEINPERVAKLVAELNAPTLRAREAAESSLVKLGPDVLTALPAVTRQTPPETRMRLTRIRAKLTRDEAQAFLLPSRVTVHAEKEPVWTVLQAMAKQTRNRIVDGRKRFSQPLESPPVTVNLDEAPFWPSLDGILDKTGLAVYPYGGKDAICIVKRTEGQLPPTATAVYYGPLRFQPTTLVARRDARFKDAASLQIDVEIAWEPRLSPIRITQKMSRISAADDQGRAVRPLNGSAVIELPVKPNASAVTLSLPFEIPPRGASQIAKLQGSLEVLMPGKPEEFRFPTTAASIGKTERISRASVTLSRIRRTDKVFEIWIRVRYDEAFDALESHRGWFLDNPAYLITKDGKRIDNGGSATTDRSESEVGLTYFFEGLDSLEGCMFVYETPGLLQLSPIDYVIQYLPLP